FASATASSMSFNKLADCETFGSPERAANSDVPRPSQTLPPSVAVSRLKIIEAFKSVLCRRRQVEQQPAGARNQVCQLIRQARQVIELTIHADRCEDRVGPTLPQAFRQLG